MAAHRGRPRRRRDGHPRHPLHGGGRAPRRPHRADRRRPRRGPRHARRDRLPRRRRAAAPVPAVRPDRRRAPDRAARGPQREPARPDGRGRRHRQPRAAVTSVLARNQIVANELRIEQADLDDAFVALTGRKLASHPPRLLQETANAQVTDPRRDPAVLPRARGVAAHDPAADDRPGRRRPHLRRRARIRCSAGGAGSTSSRRRWSS